MIHKNRFQFQKSMIRTKKAVVFLTVITLLLSLLCGCGRRQEAYEKTFFCFDTVVTLTIYADVSGEEQTRQLLEEAAGMCEFYDSMLSRTKEGSDIYEINHAGGEWTFVSDETISLLYQALSYCDVTGGKIDITIAPAKDLWDFDPDGSMAVPTDAQLAQALSHVDYHNVELSGNKVRLADPQAAIDLGFIAKGYIADQLKSYLLSKQVDSALINLGGNVLAIGEKPDHTPFRVAIRKPFAAESESLMMVDCADRTKDTYASVVTSGIYERYFMSNDKLYHHILDSSTGKPVKTDLNSVTILTDSSTQADALSTVCMILGKDDGISFLTSLGDGVEAIFVTRENEVIDTRDLKK